MLRMKEIQLACPKCAVAKNMGRQCTTHWVAWGRASAKARGQDWNDSEAVRDRMMQAHCQMLGFFMQNGGTDREAYVPTTAVLASIAERNRIWAED